jgi:glycosyltransferase involved in cell wall biosynthesis
MSPAAWHNSARSSAPRERPGLRVLVVGGEDHQLRLPFLIALRKNGFEVGAAGTGAADAFTNASIPYFAYAFDRLIDPLSDIRALLRLRRIISDFAPDVIQAFDTKPCILAPIAAAGQKHPRIVRTVNGLGWVYSTDALLGRALRPILDRLYDLTARSTTLTIFQNKHDMAYFEKFGTKGAACLIPGSGLDIRGFEMTRPSASSTSTLRRELGLQGKRTVITVTRISRIKGIPSLLDAAQIICERRQDVRFLLVGPLDSEGRLGVTRAEIARHAPYVIAPGKRDDVPTLLGLADVFAFPTELREGVPRVLLEAALARVPIVTTNMPGCTDVVEDGITGLVVRPRDPDALAEAILCLLDNPQRAKQLADQAGARVERDFDLDLTVERYARAYSDIASQPRPADAD